METYFTPTLIIIEIIFSTMVLNTLKKSGSRRVLLLTLGAIFAVWLLGVYAMLSNGFFSATGIPQIAFAVVLALPIVLGLLAQKFWKPFAIAINELSTASFLGLQQMRVVFGALFFFTASLPLWFQFVGGLGDIAAGVGAFFALQYLRQHPDKERQAIIRGNLVGILDFIVVLNLGLFVVLRRESPDIMFDLIPLYVVPIFILLHIFSLQKLRELRRSSAND